MWAGKVAVAHAVLDGPSGGRSAGIIPECLFGVSFDHSPAWYEIRSEVSPAPGLYKHFDGFSFVCGGRHGVRLSARSTWSGQVSCGVSGAH